MITACTIDWQPMEAMPEERKDGRDVLLAFRYENATINQDSWLYSVGRWWGGDWRYGDDQRRAIGAGDPDFWSDINPPE